MNFWKGLPTPIIGLAPMDGVTDAAFRHTVAIYGKPDITFTEFTHVHDVCRGPEFLLESLLYSEVERPIIAQLYGKDPALFYQAAHVVCELGFDGLDINMGCPARHVTGGQSGSALMRDLAHATSLIEATIAAVKVPVTLKMRLGWDDRSRNAPERSPRKPVGSPPMRRG